MSIFSRFFDSCPGVHPSTEIEKIQQVGIYQLALVVSSLFLDYSCLKKLGSLRVPEEPRDEAPGVCSWAWGGAAGAASEGFGDTSFLKGRRSPLSSKDGESLAITTLFFPVCLPRIRRPL